MSDTRKTKKELIEELNMLRTLINKLPDHIYAKDREGRFLLVNEAQAHYMGAETPEELIGKSDFDFYPPELARQYLADEQALLESGQPLIDHEEPNIDRQAGEETWTSTTKVPFRDSRGRVVGIVGISRDITGRKQAEEALEKAYAEVEKQVEERTAELQREAAEREQAQEENLRLQQEVIEAQKRAIQELSTPIIPVLQRVIVMPLVGSIDTMRARDITRRLLTGIREHRARVVIVDITGVPIVDSGVAAHLNKTIQAARLKGARTIVTGVSDAVAETIVDLGIDWSGIDTLADLQTGLRSALAQMGLRIGT
jgi:rsbT co-antagonist protein RsbR